MKFENIRVYNFENAFRGMRNPKNSWHLSDSFFGLVNIEYDVSDYDVVSYWCQEHNDDETARWEWLLKNGVLAVDETTCVADVAFIGPKDMKLAKTLIKGGSEHRKFLRQIMVSVDITAPLYWWKEFDTYKIGTTANSTSTMHKLTSKPITLECFEIDDFQNDLLVEGENGHWHVDMMTDKLIEHLENLRQAYIRTKDKRYWKELVRWLPESWLQTRTVTMNYENLLSMCHQREHHKLTEWSKIDQFDNIDSFLKFAHSLPYAEDLIFS